MSNDLNATKNKDKKKMTNKCIQQHNCVHEWTDDYIDIHPEKMIRIFYCIKCEYTKKN